MSWSEEALVTVLEEKGVLTGVEALEKIKRELLLRLAESRQLGLQEPRQSCAARA